MQTLIADRFVECGRAWIDIASGSLVRLHRALAGDRATQLAWSDRCGELARLRHPLINPLIDYGVCDAAHTFEAYALQSALRAPGPVGSLLLTHAVRFIESRGLRLTREIAQAALRDVSAGYVRSRGRPLGVVLQPRAVFRSIEEALDQVAPGGITRLDICGEEGAGLRTCRLVAARAARTAGYVPVSSGVLLRIKALRPQLWQRHLCILLDDTHSTVEHRVVATLLADLGTASARRHVLLRFVRARDRRPGMLWLDPLEASAMTAMVFVDRDCGPSSREITDAARVAGGYPGAFVRSLRASWLDDRPPPVPSISMVHETAPIYVVAPSRPGRHHHVGRALLNAPAWAARLALAGRHAAAVRVLTRACRVLEARGEADLAAAAAEQLAWIARDRGDVDRATECFERARRLAVDGALRLRASIGIGIIWTDQRRFVEADAALRAAAAAADLLNDRGIEHRAWRALARCLYWQSRHDEAAAVLERVLPPACGAAGSADAWSLLARTRAAQGDLRGAVTAAAEAVARAGEDGLRSVASAARSMAVVQLALGDHAQARAHLERGLGAAASAHLPLAALELRMVLATIPNQNGAVKVVRRARLRRLPPLLAALVEDQCKNASAATVSEVRPADRTLALLQELFETAQMASDDGQALTAVCEAVCSRVRGASVQIVAGPPDSRTLARAGRPWQGDVALIERVLATGTSAREAGVLSELRQAIEPVRYGSHTIAAVCVRWAPGVPVEERGVTTLLRAASLASAASVRALLDEPTGTGVTHAICSELIGSSPQTTALRDAIVRAARAPFPVIIEGESGSGKELVARGIHRLSARRDRRLCTLNCAALSDDLVEAELFGHARGAFTGAVSERAGLFEESDGGTLFLDEVGELSARAQAKLLRVLQDGEVRRVGENLPRRVDARIVAATNRQLDQEVEGGRFRADLRFRLDVVRIVVPPLRDRAPDIPALASHFWNEAARRVGSSATLTTETLAALARYDWPGNVRELQNVAASLAVHAPRRGRVTPALLPAHIAKASTAAAVTFEAARTEFERRFLRAALARAGGRRVVAARVLGVSRQGLSKMLRRLGVSDGTE